MGKRLSEAEVARYGRDGSLYPLDAFDRDDARHYLGELESLERRAGQEFAKGHNFKPHRCATRRHHDRIETATRLAAGADPLPRGRGLYRGRLRPGAGRSNDLYPQRVGRRRQRRQLDVKSWMMDSVMGWRPRALLRRIDPDRQARPPSGSAAVCGPTGLALAFFLCLLVASCAQPVSSADDNRPGGFYGGVSGGMTRP